ncbi:sulfotransferase family 2 domain-containing protein [Bacillus cereus group sp. MYBK30-2]|uniref:sulfotransferase family 2 domain-containing protein n=2 Tax=unclassified Bacillus cereus group TaxID=2750818 RepID=UPI003F7959EC
MKMKDCNSLLKIHLHMPKTAGTTLKVLMRKNYPPEKIIDLYDSFRSHEEVVKKLNSLPLEETEWINCHLSFGIHEHLSRPATYVTILRDPIERIISDYFFILNNPGHGLHKEVSRMDLLDFQSQAIHTNKQCKVILGLPLAESVNRNDVKKAQKILEDYFCFVGITELFTESAFLMKELFNWPRIKISNRNVTINRPKATEISDEVIQKIRENNKVDIALYEHARQEVEEKIAGLDPTSKRQLKAILSRTNLQ